MKTVLMTACLFVPALIGAAQQQEEADTIVRVMDEIIVSANRWEQNLGDVPMRISTISSTLARFQNPQTAADLLGSSGNIFVQKSQLGGGSPMIRGFATNRVLIVVDGIRMNNAIFRSGNVQNVISIDPGAIERTEIVFGPGAVMYGSDAIGGVMNFTTVRPEFQIDEKPMVKANAMARFSSANQEGTAHVGLSVGLEKWAFVTSISRSMFDDLRMGSKGPDDYIRPNFVIRQNDQDVIVPNDDPRLQVSSGYSQWSAMQKIAYRIDQDTKATYALQYSATSDYPRYDRLILEEEGGLANAEWYYGPQKWLTHALTLERDRATRLFDQAKFIVAYQEFEESRHNRSFGSNNRTDRTENVRALSVNFDLNKRINDRTTLLYGAEFVGNRVGSVAQRENISTGAISPTSTRYPDGAVWRAWAAYGNVKFDVNEEWSLNASSRITTVYTSAHFDNTFFDFPFSEAKLNNTAISGALGMIYNPSTSLKVYTNFSTGFRAPNVDDVGKVFDSEPGTVVVPNPSLKAENAYNVEAGLVAFAGSSLKLDLAGYYTYLDNAIARGVTTFNGEDSIYYDGVYSRVLSQQNISQVRIGGVQAGLDWEIAGPLKLSATFNYQKGRELDPETGRDFSPTHVAPMFGSAHLIYSKRSIRVDLYNVFNGEIAYANLALSERADVHLYAKDSDGNPYSPSWWTLNLKAEGRLSNHLRLSGGVENILDKRYRQYSSGISAPGRNFIIALYASL